MSGALVPNSVLPSVQRPSGYQNLVVIYLAADPYDRLDRIVIDGTVAAVKAFIQQQQLLCVAELTCDEDQEVIEIQCNDVHAILKALAPVFLRYDIIATCPHHPPLAKLLPAGAAPYDDGVVIDMGHYLYADLET